MNAFRNRTRLASVLAVVMTMLGLGVVVAGPASAKPGNLAGTWVSEDTDGSNQTLQIKGAGKPTYSTSYYDDRTGEICGGAPAKLVGPGKVDGDVMVVRGTLVCLPGGNPRPREPFVIGYVYDAGDDTLTDDFGVVWERG